MASMSNGVLNDSYKPQADASLQKIKTVTLLTWGKDGVTGKRQAHTLYISKLKDMQFVIKVLPYIAMMLDCPHEVRGNTAEAAINAFEKQQREFHDKMKMGTAKPVLVVNVETGRPWHDHKSRDRDAVFNVSYQKAFLIAGELHEVQNKWVTITKEEYIPDRHGDYRSWGGWNSEENKYEMRTEVPGRKNPFINGTPIDYTPELHDGIDAILERVSTAGAEMKKLVEAKDLVALLGRAPMALPAPAAPADPKRRIKRRAS